MDPHLAELEQDIDELKNFLSLAKRERTKKILAQELKDVEKQLLVVSHLNNLFTIFRLKLLKSEQFLHLRARHQKNQLPQWIISQFLALDGTKIAKQAM